MSIRILLVENKRLLRQLVIKSKPNCGSSIIMTAPLKQNVASKPKDGNKD